MTHLAHAVAWSGAGLGIGIIGLATNLDAPSWVLCILVAGVVLCAAQLVRNLRTLRAEWARVASHAVVMRAILDALRDPGVIRVVLVSEIADDGAQSVRIEAHL